MAKINLTIILLCSSMLWTCQGKQTKERQHLETHDTAAPTFQPEIIPAPGNTFGYNILKNGKIYIHQPHIPAISGNKAFNTEAQAQKAAEFVILKINRNIIPPTVTAVELDSLGVLD